MAPPPHGRRRSSLTRTSPIFTCLILPFLLAIISFTGPVSAAGSAVLGIDVGTEYFKAALVKPGIPLEIVLTKDSKRKESAAVAFKPTRDSTASFPERFYGGDALALAARYPDDVYINLKTLLGVPFDEGKNEFVRAYHGRYPALRLESAPGERGTVAVRSGKLGEAEGKDAFLVEELLAMQLKQIKANADTLAGKGSDIRDAVITYPAFYTAEEKRSLELAVELAGLNAEALISDGLAVGLNFATSRTFPSVSDGQKPEYHIVYDMGAGSTTATVLRFQSKTVKDVGRFNKTVQEIHVLGVGWDRTLGGDSLNQLLLNDMIEHLADHKQLKGRVTVSEIKTHGKTVARLLKDAEKIRQVLSANTETSTSFEGLFEDEVNFKYKVSRARFEELASAYAAEVGQPLKQALAAAGLTLGDIDSVILHGGASRTPFVQKELEKLCGSAAELRTNVNADEAAVFGAAFKGAALSPNFRVKDIRAHDAANYAVLLKWQSDDGKERQQKLFTPTSVVGVEKQVTVKNLEDFEFSFHQLVSGAKEKAVVELPVSGVQTTNLTATVEKLKGDFGCVSANITTKFVVRLSPVDGLPEVVSGSVNCEVEQVKKGGIVEDVKGLFGLGSKKGEQEPLGEEQEASESITLEAEEPPASTASAASDATSTTTTATTTNAQEGKKTATPETRVESIPIGFTTSALGMPAPSPSELSRIQSRLTAFDASDRDRILREEALNELESFIYRSRDLVDDEEFIKTLKADQLTLLKERVASASDWLYGEGDTAKTADLNDKLKALKEIVDPALKRKKENAGRPAKVEALQDALKNAKMVTQLMEQQIKADEDLYSSSVESTSDASTTSAATTISSSTTSEPSPSPPSSSETGDPFADLDDDPYSSSTKSSSSSSSKTTSATKSGASPSASGPKYTLFHPTDLTTLRKTVVSTTEWLETQLALQEELSQADDPALTVAELNARSRELERVLARLYEKMGAKAAKADSKSEPKAGGGADGEEPKVKKTKTKSKSKGKNGKKEKSTGTSSSSSTTTSTTTSVKESSNRKDEL